MPRIKVLLPVDNAEIDDVVTLGDYALHPVYWHGEEPNSEHPIYDLLLDWPEWFPSLTFTYSEWEECEERDDPSGYAILTFELEVEEQLLAAAQRANSSERITLLQQAISAGEHALSSMRSHLASSLQWEFSPRAAGRIATGVITAFVQRTDGSTAPMRLQAMTGLASARSALQLPDKSQRPAKSRPRISRKLGYLSQVFAAAAADLLPDAQYEVELGRYRVDVLLRDHRLIVELDGKKEHGSWEACGADRLRDRYFLTRGYRTVRFTSDELSDAARCVRQVLEILRAEQPIAPPAGALFVDWTFLHRENMAWRRKNVASSAPLPFVSRYLRAIAALAQIEGHWDVFIYSYPGDLAGGSIDFDVLRSVTLPNSISAVLHEWQLPEMIAVKLCEHMMRSRFDYGKVGLIADDSAYPPLLASGPEPHFLFCCAAGASSMASVSTRKMDIAALIAQVHI